MGKLTSFLTLSLLLLSSYSLKSFAIEDIKVKKITKKTIKLNQANPDNFTNHAILQNLNKITAKTEKLEIEIGKEVQFGKLDITVKKCWKSSPYEKPENKILIEIFQRNTKDKKSKSKNRIFYGWMFSSSPSISSLEHPIYDITAVECINKK